MAEINNIQNIIFDLGGVILNIDYSRPIRALDALGIQSGKYIFTLDQPDPTYALYETGKIQTDIFLDYLQQSSSKPITKDNLIKAWNAILVDLPRQHIELLRKFKNQYRIFLLSNINELHIEAFEKMYANLFPDKQFVEEMDKVYYSCRIGYRKPQPEAFIHILNDQNIKASNTLFVDDSITHIRGATSLGLETYHINPSNNQTLSILAAEMLT
ncbi:MAG: HAD family phosphatase [Flavobacteriales bacterium]|nr:HAD family phosphatase [Flavobacteriales bacterium]